MIIAFMSDIHANLPALRSALAVAGQWGAERIVVCGDIVGDGPFPAETVELLRTQRDLAAIRGNVDRKVLRLSGKKRKKLSRKVQEGPSKRRNLAWTALQLGDENLEWLENLPTELRFRVDDLEALAVHGSPLGDTDYIYGSITEEGLESKLVGYPGPAPALLVAGHSHIPFAKSVSGTMVVNCGSVGLAADGDPRGSIAIVETGSNGALSAQLVRFHYPVEETMSTIVEREVPGADPESYLAGIKRR